MCSSDLGAPHGVVVGSALVDALGSGGLPAAERLIKDLAAAVRGNGT